jgi:DNA-binding XRE family transcriptional regulator
MNMLLEALRNLRGYDKKELARLLCISEIEYREIETGPLELTEQQANTVAELFKSNTPTGGGRTGVTIYNFGPGSRAITNVTNYYECDEEKSKPENDGPNKDAIGFRRH